MGTLNLSNGVSLSGSGSALSIDAGSLSKAAPGTVLQRLVRYTTDSGSSSATDWTEAGPTSFRITLTDVKASNNILVLNHNTKIRTTAFANIARTLAFQYSTDSGSNWSQIGGTTGSYNQLTGDNHFPGLSHVVCVNDGTGPSLTLSDGIVFRVVIKTTNSSYPYYWGGSALGAVSFFEVLEIQA
jgi:hypothetical protein